MSLPGKIVFAVVAACPLAVVMPGVAAAQHITIDGTLGGKAQTLTGPNYTIDANLGKQAGSNLFHSFGQFSLFHTPTPESATFTATGSTGPISNVIGRVTGGSPSSINGAIKSTIAGANLYLINPSGIVFGPNATVDVKGAFHASTADYLKLGKDTRFLATHPNGTVSAAAPAAFGFLTASPARITVNGSTLMPGPAPLGSPPANLGLVGGTVSITGGMLKAPGGTIHLASVAGTGEVPVDPTSAAALTVKSFGAVNIASSTLDVSNKSNPVAGGSVFVHAGTLTINASQIDADNYGSGSGGQLVLRGEGNVALGKGTLVHAVAQGSGSGARVVISTAATGVIAAADDASIMTGSNGPGNGGMLSVVTGQLTVTKGAGFTSVAQGSGNGGDISVTANSVLLDVNAPVDPNTGLFSPIGIFSDTFGTGHGSSITITAGQLTLHNGASVLAESDGAGIGGAVSVSVGGALTVDSGATLGTLATAGGNAGEVSIKHAGQVTVDMSAGFASSILLGIGSLTEGTDNGSGNAGDVTVAAGDLTISSGGLVSSLTLGAGNSGRLSVKVSGVLSVSDDVFNANGISASSDGTGNAGQVVVTAGTLSIAGKGIIASDSFVSGDAGSVSVTAGTLSVVGGGRITSDSSGNVAGSVSVNAGSMAIGSSGLISASTLGGTPGASGGGVSVMVAGELTIDGAGGDPNNPIATGIVSDAEPGSLGNAGTVNVSAGSLSIASNGEISSATFASGKGGDVIVKVASQLTLDGAGGTPSTFLTGITTTSEGRGIAGDVTVTAGTLSIAHNGLISSSIAKLPGNGPASGNGGSVSVTVDGQLTIDGTGTNPDLLATGIAANSLAGSTGNAGDVRVQAGAISLINGGAISSALVPDGNFPASTGNAGKVSVDVAGLLSVSGAGSRIGTETMPGSIGHAGSVAVMAQQIALADNAQITSATSGSGDGGSVAVNAKGGISIDASEISADTLQLIGGNAHDLTVNATTLSLTDGGQISTRTLGSGNGGNVHVTTTNGVTLASMSEITAEALPGSSGVAGNVVLNSGGAVALSGGAEVTSSTAGAGIGGTVQVTARGSLTLTDPGTGIVALAASSASGNAGSVTVNAPQITIGTGAEIASTTAGTGSGGSVDVTTPGVLTLDGGGDRNTEIAASATGPQSGPGGNVSVGAGSLTINGGGEIASSTAGLGKGGDVDVAIAGNVALSGAASDGTPSEITAEALPGSSGGAGEVVLNSGGAVALAGGAEVTSSTAGAGNGGTVRVAAQGPLSLSDPGTGIVALAASSASGNAGSVSVNAPLITIATGAEIASTTAGTGAGGSVSVATPGALAINGMGNPMTEIAASATGPQSGPGGDVSVAAGSLTIDGGGEIASSTAGPGKGGDVDVAIAGNVALSGTASDGTASEITAEALPESSGQAGAVVLTAGGAVALSGGAEVTSSTAGAGNGGTVRVAAQGPLTLTDPGTGIVALASSTASGNAGSVTVTAPHITLTAGGAIASTTAGAGNGGSVAVTTPGALVLDGQGNPNTQIAASATGPQSGSGGDVIVNAASLLVQGGAEIASTTAGPGRGGDVAVAVAGDIVLPDRGPQITARSTGSGDAGSITVSAVNLRLRNGAAISTEAQTSTASGGNITLSVGDFLYLVGSEITTSVKGETGNGGNITIDPRFVILDRSDIIAQAIEGHGGDITINAGAFIASADSIVSASSQLGISGIVTINGPLVNLNGTLVVLSSELRNAAALTRDSCAARGNRPQSSLVEAGRGGLPQDPDATLPALYIAGRDFRPGPHAAAEPAQTQPPLQTALQTTVHLTMRCGEK